MDPALDAPRPHDHRRVMARLTIVAVTAVALLLSGTAPVLAAPPAPPVSLPAAIEPYQPYVGQKVCDPVAKPGVRAFSTMVLNAYRGTTSLGIVRDCGIGASSEHKEGRAWDWGVSAYNSTQAAQVKELLTWLLATDKADNPHANLRRLGIMYVIWNKQIFKAYDPGLGWRPYTGPSPHTDHVHFSFGWSGAKKATSFWDGTVAAVDPGPAKTAPPPVPTPVVPVPDVANLQVLARYGATTLRNGSTGEGVELVQRPLGLSVDGDYGNATTAAVAAFQRSQGLEADGVFGPMSWRALFPKPTQPYGELELVGNSLGKVVVRGWAVDAEVTDPARLHLYVNGAYHSAATVGERRDDVAADNPGTAHLQGYDLRLSLPDGTHRVCAHVLNAPGTAGSNVLLGCQSLAVSHVPAGALTGVTQGPTGVLATGWAVDPDVAAPIAVDLTVNGKKVTTVRSASLTSPAVTESYPDHGSGHGFRTALSLPQGTSTVCAVGRNAAGTPGADRSLGCVKATVRHDPTGALDADIPTPGKVVVAGWSVDPDSAAPVGVHVYVDGKFAAAAKADRSRSGLPAALAAYGRAHGYVAHLKLAEGTRTVCAFGLNAPGTAGRNASLGCHKVAVRHSPMGRLDLVTSGIGGVDVTGWAIDPDVAAPTAVRVLVGGKVVKTLTANGDRPDVARHYPAYGPRHGVQATLSLPEGTHSVCLQVVNAKGTPGADVSIRCRSVVVQHRPTGSFDSILPGPDGVRVTGWAIDPDTAAPVRVQVLANGRKVADPLADVARPDVARLHPAHGPRHGLLVDRLELPLGTHSVCLVALNAAGPGGAVRLGCRDVRVEQDGKGALEAVTPVAGGAVVRGWALDPDTAGQTKVHLYVGGTMKVEVPADLGHAGVQRAWPLYGPAHGFSTRLALARGVHRVCAFALNAAGTPGRHTLVGCRPVSVT
jgi:peptidoglycan hydrolase-like protein with peptidoglycan-binding domain